jgi:3-methyladenine DNA glycosylase/8-oxoguanine DNA glycosylase
MLARTWRLPVDVVATLSPHRRGPRDPAYRMVDGAVLRASLTPEGPGTIRVTSSAGTVRGEAWGPGGAWLLDALPGMLGAEDDISTFVPHHDVLKRAAARRRDLRIGRSGRVFEALVPAILEQKVPSAEAWRAWSYLVRRFGTPAPDPGGLDRSGSGGAGGLFVPPSPEVWAKIPSWEWHRSGAEAVRARTIVSAARVASRLECADGAELDRRLRSLPGIGIWTSAEVRQRALGDADAVSVGDYHLPGVVGWALTGEKVDDDGMLKLLEPYAGHRHRVTRLLEMTRSGPPRRGPRMSVRDYRSF